MEDLYEGNPNDFLPWTALANLVFITHDQNQHATNFHQAKLAMRFLLRTLEFVAGKNRPNEIFSG